MDSRTAGYGDLAFEEAIRHVDAVSDVYQAGKLGTYVTEPTLWENYSSEYTRNGYSGTSSNSRPHFAGWTGSFGIGMMIENILGVDINAPDNIITWDVRLSEEHGVDNLYMCHEGVENRVSLHAGSRTSASSTLNFTITTEQPVTVVVNACGGTRTINAEPGTHSYTIEGVDEGAQAGYVGAIAYPIDMTDETVMNMLSKDYLDENAKDYVIFGTEINETVDDGIGYQYGKSDIIYNVNTVGIPWTQTGENPTVLSDSTLMDELGFDGAQSVSKGYHIYGDEGFMFMAPAGTGLQTLRAVVGVKGGNAELKAALSDASDTRVTIPVSGGEEESLYYIDIPFRADSDGRNILVKWTVDTDKSSSSAEISLKSVALFDGGYFIPGEPEEIEVTFAEDDITVNAAAPMDETYDVWHVELYNDDGDMVDSVSTDTMPVTFENLDYYEKYYARVAGEKDGITGIYGTSDTVLLEEEGMTDADRVQKDLEMTLDAIYNGNTERNVINDFNTNVEGVLYGSEFSLVSSTDGETAGVQNGGRVIRAVNGVDKVSSIIITAAYNGETAVHENDVVVRALDTGGEYAIAHTDTVYQNQVFLSEEGTKDWVQIVSDFGSGEPQAEKKDGTGIENLIRVHDAVPGGESGMMTDAPVTYIYDSDDCGDVTPVNNRGSHMRGVGNYLQFDVPYSDKYQTVNLYCGVWYAEARVEFLINGVPVASETYSADALRTFKITFDYKLDDPTDKASVRLILTNDNIVETNDNGSAYINAITLSESDTAFA